MPYRASEDPGLSRGPIARGHFDSFVGVPILAQEPDRLLPEVLQPVRPWGPKVGCEALLSCTRSSTCPRTPTWFPCRISARHLQPLSIIIKEIMTNALE